MNLKEAVFSKDERAIYRLRSLYMSYGYRKYRMSKFEEYDFYVRNKGFLVSDNIITFTDSDGKLMALKPDVTLSIIKNSKYSGLGVEKVYYNENVYRAAEDKQIKEIMQTGLECIGNIDDYCMCEVVLLAAKSLEYISPDYVLDISNMEIISEAMAFAGVGDGISADILRAFGEKNVQGVEHICKINNISKEGTDLLKSLVTLYGRPGEVLPKLKQISVSDTFRTAIGQMENITKVLEENGCGENVRIDFSVVNNMKYYSGIAFKGFINGIHGGVLSGGQYDKLMQKMGKRTGAIGFAVYLDMLGMLENDAADFDTDVLLIYGESETAADISRAVRQLSEGGVSVMAQCRIPEKTRYRKLMKLEKGQVITVE